MKTARTRNGKVGQDKSALVARLPRACSDELEAVKFLEEQRWGLFSECPHCGPRQKAGEKPYAMRSRQDNTRRPPFRWQCRNKDCRKQFTVRTGTVLEDSRIPLRHWCYAFWAACSSKKGVSALQIKRQTGLSYKSALFLMHRIRFAMSDDNPRQLAGTIEADETYVGGKPRYRSHKRGGLYRWKKTAVLVAVERNGEARVAPAEWVSGRTVGEFLRRHVAQGQVLMTDEAPLYIRIGRPWFRDHQAVNHSAGEYARGDAHNNTAECFFSLVKRGMYGTFHSVSKKHLHRYLTEFEFRFNTRKIDDGERTLRAIRAGVGKRLLYREPINA